MQDHSTLKVEKFVFCSQTSNIGKQTVSFGVIPHLLVSKGGRPRPVETVSIADIKDFKSVDYPLLKDF